MKADFGVVLDACASSLRIEAMNLWRRCHAIWWKSSIKQRNGRSIGRSDPAGFPSAWVDDGYKSLIPVMRNDVKDRHVLAAAVRAKCELIVTYNKKHFPCDALDPWGVMCKVPRPF